jgi:hypothetical protein
MWRRSYRTVVRAVVFSATDSLVRLVRTHLGMEGDSIAITHRWFRTKESFWILQGGVE